MHEVPFNSCAKRKIMKFSKREVPAEAFLPLDLLNLIFHAIFHHEQWGLIYENCREVWIFSCLPGKFWHGQNFLFYWGGKATNNQTERVELALYLRGWVTTKIIKKKKKLKNICDRLSSFPSLVRCKNMPCCWAAQMSAIIYTTPWASQ